MGVDSTNPDAVKRHRPQGGADRDRRDLKRLIQLYFQSLTS